MYHLYRLKTRKYAFAFVTHGRFIGGSVQQGYEKKTAAIHGIRLMNPKAYVQYEGKVYILHADTGKLVLTDRKPTKPYQP